MRRWRNFFLHWENWLGLSLILLFLAGAVFAPLISPQDEKHPGAFKQIGRASDFVPHPPTKDAILGTLPGQYDVFHTLVWGMRDAMQFGLLVAVGSFLIGIFLGSASGYAGGFINSLVMRIADAFLTFPPLAGVVFLQQLVGISITALGGLYYFDPQFFGRVLSVQTPQTPLVAFMSKVDPLMISLILFSWVPYARLVNSIVLTLKRTDFIQATRALGGGSSWIIRKHLIPNSIGPAIVLGARDVGSAVVLQATITFIGLAGASPWGTLLSMGRNFVIGPGGSLLTHWWVFLPATLAVVLFGISWNLIGDGLNDILTPGSPVYFRRGSSSKELTELEEQPSIERDFPIPGAPSEKGTSAEKKVLQIPPSEGKPSSNGADPILYQAREEAARGNLSRALHSYSHLIRRGKSLTDVRTDLARLVKNYPREGQVWQTLGDALALSGDPEHAAQCYEQARKLMQ